VGDPYNLDRFVRAQEDMIDRALEELRCGMKENHWMWFIFPQLAGLGHSAKAEFYGIESVDEARSYLDHRVLGPRLLQCVEALMAWSGRRSAEQILGHVDAMKLRSSLTLFDTALPNDIYAAGLSAFFDGEPDQRTLALLNGHA
jgi:uncharacterized protein (DUF1810 family)